MRKLIALLVAMPLGVCLLNADGKTHSHVSTMSMSDDGDSDACRDHLHMYNDEFRQTVTDEVTATAPNQPLTITAEHNGGIQVSTWDKPEFALKLCKQVAANDENRARQLLAETRLEVGSGRVTVRGPERDGDYSLGTVLLVKAPRNATLDLTVHNGGVSLNGFVGTATAHADNGGISLKKSSGKLTVEAHNGGISIKDCGGDISADVQNGGLSIALPERWEGKGLEAHTHNGGLVVAVPKNLESGVEIVGSTHTSIICKDDVCGSAARTWDESGRRMLRFGGASPQIRATTINGGVVVEQRGRTRGEL